MWDFVLRSQISKEEHIKIVLNIEQESLSLPRHFPQDEEEKQCQRERAAESKQRENFSEILILGSFPLCARIFQAFSLSESRFPQ